MSGVAGRAGPDQDQAPAETGPTSIRIAGTVWRRLLAIQYERKMAGESVSFSEIIGQLLDRAGAA